jgi:hypothetical protein
LTYTYNRRKNRPQKSKRGARGRGKEDRGKTRKEN